MADPDTPDAPDDAARRAALESAAARVRAAYAAGAPLFSRAALARVAAVLDADGGAARAGRAAAAVTLAGVDGRGVHQATAVGHQETTNGITVVNVRPRLEYWPVERLTGTGRWHARRFDAARACVAVRLGHETVARGVAADDGTVVEDATVGAVAARLARRAAGLPDRPRPAVDDPETLAAWFGEQRAQWEASAACRQLRETIAAAWPPGLAARTVVAFACGSLADPRLGVRARARHAAHHALALTLADALARVQGCAVRCVAQDPAYDGDAGAADAAVLAGAGIAVAADPHGFLAVDAAAVVVAVAPAVPVMQVVADLARPAAMLWRRVPQDQGDLDPTADPLYELGGSDDPVSPRVRALVAGYAEHPFDGEARLFGTEDGLALYIRD